MIEISPLAPADRPHWAELWRLYLAFYGRELPEARYTETWSRLMDGTRIHGLGARHQGRLVGITHYLFHASTWMDDVCYLQDLFVDSSVRGQGAGRALIEAVADAARRQGSPRLYWSTQESNATARLLYDRLATFTGFIRYDHALA